MNNYYELKVSNKPLYYIELISCLNSLTEGFNNDVFKNFCNDKEFDFISRIKNFRLKGREFFEFTLHMDELDDIDIITSKLDSMSHIDFIYIFFGDELTKEDVEILYEDSNLGNEIINQKIEAKRLKLHDLEILFKDTKNFKKDFFSTLSTIDKFIKQENIIDSQIYSEKVKKIALELKEKAPLNIAQDMMGKKFKRVFDFNHYIFVPCFYFIHKPMRVFNYTTQILIYPVNPLNSSMNSNDLAKILKIIGDKSRLDIIKSISYESYSGKELSSKIGVSTPTISHHLDQLKSIGLIYEEREKNTKYYTLNKNTYKDIIATLNNYL